MFTQEEIERARDLDLLTYLQIYDPAELVYVGNGVYSVKQHDSLQISNGKWYWFSKGYGSKSALDYLTEVQGLPFAEAVKRVLGTASENTPLRRRTEDAKTKKLLLPRAAESNEHVIQYLRHRGIDEQVIRYCIRKKLLYESETYRNAVFIGYDKDDIARHATIRSTTGLYKGEATGSDKRYSFSMVFNSDAYCLHVFEAPIDALSFASIRILEESPWKTDSLLSLAGVYKRRREAVLPVALDRFLNDYPLITDIYLHLDNDETGESAAKGIREALYGRYNVADEPPIMGKDVNDELQYLIMRRSLNGR